MTDHIMSRTHTSPCPALLALATALASTAACITAPPVVLLDHKTALEHQAAGSYELLDRELAQAALSPGAEPLTAGQLAERGAATGAPMEELVRLHLEMRAHADVVDRLLLRRCVGEAADGALRATVDRCPEGTDLAEVRRTAARANRERRQLWEFIRERRPEVSLEAIRATWRRHHLRRVRCGAPLETPDGGWAPKPC